MGWSYGVSAMLCGATYEVAITPNVIGQGMPKRTRAELEEMWIAYECNLTFEEWCEHFRFLPNGEV